MWAWTPPHDVAARPKRTPSLRFSDVSCCSKAALRIAKSPRYLRKDRWSSTPVLGVITLLGAAFLAYLAFESIRVLGVEVSDEKTEPKSIRKGFMANLLNPHPYLFWFVIGAPTLLKAWTASVLAAALFIIGLYVCLVGSKILIAWLVARSRGFLKSRGYLYVNRLLGAALVVFALLFLRDGVRFLGFELG